MDEDKKSKAKRDASSKVRRDDLGTRSGGARRNSRDAHSAKPELTPSGAKELAKNSLLSPLTANELPIPDMSDPIPLELFWLRRKAEMLALQSGFEKLRSLDFIKGVELHDYQKRTVRHVLRTLGGRALLADEVGLGKTIEAGTVLKELDIRGLVRSILILTPATLVSQWQGELENKFGLSFHRGKNQEDWQKYPRIVASLDTAKSPRHAREILETEWDLVIIDEAHRLKNHRTRNFKFANRIRSRYLLLLSATPFQNHLIELFNIVTLLRPGQLETEKQFRKNHLVKGSAGEVRDPESLRELLQNVMVRNRRGEVGIEFVPRYGETRKLPMPADQAALYRAAVDFCRRRFPEIYQSTAALVTLGYLRMLCGSPFRFRESLVRNFLPRAEQENDPNLIQEVRHLIQLSDAVRLDAKIEALMQDLRSHDEQTIIFTHYRGTLRYIAARLRSENVPWVEFHGEMTADEKDEAIAQFKSGTRVLLTTDAGSEGRNLQFCWRVINYDLPWNPMKVEQRIGRVHRMGQTRDVIITSYTLEGTIEDDLLTLLERKLGLFQLVVGEVELILGKQQVEHKLAKMFLESHNDEEWAKKLEEFGEQIAKLRTDYEDVNDRNQQVLAGMGASAATIE